MNKATQFLIVTIIGVTPFLVSAQEEPRATDQKVAEPIVTETETEVTEPIASQTEDNAEQEDGNFIPTEKIKIDSAVSFPVDI